MRGITIEGGGKGEKAGWGGEGEQERKEKRGREGQRIALWHSEKVVIHNQAERAFMAREIIGILFLDVYSNTYISKKYICALSHSIYGICKGSSSWLIQDTGWGNKKSQVQWWKDDREEGKWDEEERQREKMIAWTVNFCGTFNIL